MQLTQFTDYSLRALIFISAKKQICTVNDIATAYSISHNHLIKIIHNLSKIGIIKTTRGKNGGITMAADPQTINLKTLIVALEPNFDLAPCFSRTKETCCIAPACKLQTILYEAQNAFWAVLERFTLADVMHNPTTLLQLFKTE